MFACVFGVQRYEKSLNRANVSGIFFVYGSFTSNSMLYLNC